MTRILVTGATGFVGRHALPALHARGFEVHTLGRTPPAGEPGGDAVMHHAADLLDAGSTRAAVAAAGAKVLLHLAWYVAPGAFWRSPLNLDWTAASLHLFRSFTEAGGTRIVAAGTCAEYTLGPDRLAETAPCRPATLYGACKDALHRTLEAYAGGLGIGHAWGRVFFLYGPGEAPGRLVSGAVESLLAGRPFETTHGRQRRDFMHVADVADAFAALCASEVQGPVNIGSGSAVPVGDLLRRIGTETGRDDLVLLGRRPLAPDEPDSIEADTARLHFELGFRPRYDLDCGIAETVAWWRSQACQNQHQRHP